MAIVKYFFEIERKPRRGLLAAEWVVVGYAVLTTLMMLFLWTKLPDAEPMLMGRFRALVMMAALWVVYRLVPCRLTMLARVVLLLAMLSWWYPDTYMLNRVLPNLDHHFAQLEQTVFGCQPALLFAQKAPWHWFSELMCLGYVSYFPLMTVLLVYYFLRRYHEFLMASFVVLGAFFAYYVVFILLPVTGPQFYYLAAGTGQIAAGHFPDLGYWFLTHAERMAAPGWSDGLFYHLLDLTHDAGERPTAAFPSSHVGVTTVVMLLALRTRSRRLVLSLLPFYVLLCLSTVYILAHYAIDALAGLLTGTLLYLLLKKAYER